MFGPGDEAFEIGDVEFGAEEFDPDAALWVRGVDYVTGWAAARDAAAELGQALMSAGVEASGVRLRAGSAADGSGVVRVELSTAAAAEVTRVVARFRKAS
ncbi:hypothetical protein [Streptomyces blastmyceticus]|uniref:Uncharacterized protein n=1 Tax=Streptomyces blastmyceticus TaxID=68180 RepID=A0ABN0WNY3_9ACTN